mmetsp:Transcript_65903/g.123025  ORF Transcript_65903/g.123025 Transcript_65903/m.123025 type:complete len:436 (+) Transcript_65903:88-1395(+)
MVWLFGRPKTVLVTGAGGETGTIVVRKLLERGRHVFIVRAMVRSEASKIRLRQALRLQSDDSSLEIVIGDVTRPDTLNSVFTGIESVVILTSAVPRVSQGSIAKSALLDIFSWGYASLAPHVWFDQGQSPEDVDFRGQSAQVAAAKAAGVQHIVLVSSMAGTKPEHPLNAARGNIALWKRKGEYSLLDSGIPYTIIHVSNLIPAYGSRRPAPGSERRLLIGVDDAIVKTVLPREDLAEVCLKALLLPAAKWRSFDLGASLPGQGEAQKGDLEVLTELLGELRGKNCSYDACQLQRLRLEGKNRLKLEFPEVAKCCTGPRCGLVRSGSGDIHDGEAPAIPVVEGDAAFDTHASGSTPSPSYAKAFADVGPKSTDSLSTGIDVVVGKEATGQLDSTSSGVSHSRAASADNPQGVFVGGSPPPVTNGFAQAEDLRVLE